MEPVTWEDFVRRHGDKVRYRVVRVLLRLGEQPRPDQVEEMTQEVYCRLLERGADLLGRAGRQGEVVVYLCKVVSSVVIDRIRKERARKRGARLVDVGRYGLHRLAAGGPTVEQDLIRRERRRLILERCNRSPSPACRRRNAWILRMALFEDWRSHEIAGALGGRLSPSSVDSLVHRAVSRLTAADRELLLG